MSALFLEYALGNTLLAVPLALLAWVIGHSRRYASLAHLAWLLVMVRLVMPPVATLPWLTVSIPLLQPAASTADGWQGQETREISVAPDQRSPSPPSASMMAPSAGAGSPAAKAPRARIGMPEATISAVDQGHAVGVVGAIWLAGTVLIVAISIVRIARFRREVLMHCQPAGQAVVCLARSVADELGVRRGYALLTTRADAIPFVWSGLRAPVIVIPATLITDVHVPSLRLILMHELAHIRRRDHLVRWLDWAVVAWLWWNPLAWIARRGLRSSEELACDALVMRTCGVSSRDYGACLVAAAESFGRLAFRTPDQACTMGDGGSLEQRITIIMSGSLQRRPSLPLRTFTAGLAAACLLSGTAADTSARSPGAQLKDDSAANRKLSGAQQSTPDAQGDNQGHPITATAGSHVIRVTKAAAIDQMKLRRKPSSNGAVNMLLAQLHSASPQHRASGNQGNDQDSGGNGSGSASSGGTSGGTASGSVATSGSVTTGGNGGLVRPNIAVAFQVEASDKRIFELENMTAVDDKGEPVLWMGPGPFNFYDPDFEKGLQAEVVGYFQEENATEHLTISGDLKVTPGRRIEVEFPNGKPSTMKSGEHSFQLKDVQSNANGIHVTISLPQLGVRRGNNFGNPQKMMKAILEQEGAFEVMIVDTEGVLHSPGASASAGGSGSSSGSGGGSGTGGGSLGGASQAQSSRTFTFGGLPQGREIKSIVVRATEKTGKPQSYPFTLQNVPVPYVKD